MESMIYAVPKSLQLVVMNLHIESPIRAMHFALGKNIPSGSGDGMKSGRACFRGGSAPSWLRFLGMLLALAAILCGRAGAQATSGVTGLVTDPSGAIIVDA